MIEFVHECYQLKTGGWRPRFHLRFVAGATSSSQRFLEPRRDLSFATQKEAKDRNRILALNWRNANCPDAEIFERHSEKN
jgi:hypothetical protein